MLDYDPLDQLTYRVSELRAEFGAQPWLTVVSGVTAEAYRLAGLSSEEFFDLFQAQCAKQGRLLIHLRRKPVMRLRVGFDGGDGAISEHDGMAFLVLRFREGCYTEFDPLGGIAPRLRIFQPRSSLLLTGGYGRPVGEITGHLPRCLMPRSVRGYDIAGGSFGVGVDVKVRPHWETLALMPETVSRALGVAAQTTLDQMPWLDVQTPAREASSGARVGRVPPAKAKRPSLRLVSTS